MSRVIYRRHHRYRPRPKRFVWTKPPPVITSPYYDAVMADSPRAYYRMREASGLIQDSSGNGNHAISSTGTADYAQLSPIAVDLTDKAINFSGDDWFQVPTAASIITGDVFTVEAWVKFNAASGRTTAGVVGRGAGYGGEPDGWSVLFDGGTGNYFRFYSNSYYQGLFGPYDDTAWHHIVFTKNGAVTAFYMDGIYLGGDTAAPAVDGSTYPIYIGAAGWGGNPIDANLDEVAIYGTALSASRVLAHYNAASPYAKEIMVDGPRAYYRMRESLGLPHDQSGYGNHMTFSNGTATYLQPGPISSDPIDKAIFIDYQSPTECYFAAPYNSSLDHGDVFSIECWVKRVSLGGVQVLVGRGAGGIGNWELGFDSSGFIVMYRPGYPIYFGSNVTISDTTTWHHIVATKNGTGAGAVEIYLDGVAVGDHAYFDPVSVVIVDNTASLVIGSEPGYSTTDVLIDEIGVYATALTAARVLAHYNAAAGVPPSTFLGSDSGVGVEAISAFTRGVGDTGAGVDAALITKIATDAGTGSETALVTVPVSSSDTGTGSDIATPIYNLAESGSGTDASVRTAAFTTTDTGTGTDTGIVTVPVSASDTGTGSDTSVLAAAYSISDTGTSSEASTLAAALSGTDAASGTEAQGIGITVADSGTDTENSAIAVVLGDTGTGVDGPPNTSRQISDSGTGTDTASYTGAYTVTDSGTGIESLGARTISVSDSGTGTEDVQAKYTLQDAGVGADASTLLTDTVKVDADAGTGTDTGIVKVSVSASDTGTGSDTASLSAAYSISDSGAGTDASVLIAPRIVADAGTGLDNGIVIVVYTVVDTGFGVETVLKGVYGIDNGAAVEIASLTAALLAQDTGASADLGIIGLAKTVVDFGVGTDFGFYTLKQKNFHNSKLIEANGTISELITTRGRAKMTSANADSRLLQVGSEKSEMETTKTTSSKLTTAQ